MVEAAELTARLARCIGIWETNRGGDNPDPKESALSTVAGLPASMATIEQATMPYAIDAIAKRKALREAAVPPLSKEELSAANERCKAVKSLLEAVAAAGGKPEAFIAANAAAITAAGMTGTDVEIMFKAVTLKKLIDELHAKVEAGKIALADAVLAVPESDRLGIQPGSLKSYIRRPSNWGENRAAWQRLSVNRQDGGVGGRIEVVAESAGGVGLAFPVIRERVDEEIAKGTKTRALIKTVAQKNNPNEKAYGDNVLKIYERLYP